MQPTLPALQRLYEHHAYVREVNSYWQTTTPVPEWLPLAADEAVDIAIIGGGYTGLNCALELAESGDGKRVAILEANQPGWGASGRNGGFACMGGSKLSFDQHVQRFGKKETLNYFKVQQESVESVSENLRRYHINADTHSDGETLLAHSPKQVDELFAEARQLENELGISADIIEKNALAANGFSSPEFHAALTNPVGFALNPLKYLAGLVRQVERTDTRVFGDSPVLDIQFRAGKWHLKTPAAQISAKQIIFATNGYSSENLPEWLAGRLLPVLTNIMVTRPVTPSELADQGWTSDQMCYDTRNSLHYFHLLPKQKGEDGPRMLFGMRGGTSAAPASQAAMKKRIRADFDRIFPAWREVETTHFWSGLACLTRDLTSFTGPIPGLQNAYASLAYHGNGVAMGSYSGRLLARIIKGELEAGALPAAMRRTPSKFPFPFFRRSYLATAYKWFEWRDS